VTQYRYTGPGPDVEPVSNSVIHPGDVWSFTEAPTFGLWELVGRDAEKPSEAPQSGTPPETHEDSENAATDASGPSSTPEA
jgi:hypothetical protein